MKTKLYQKVIDLLNSNLEFVKKIKIERFKDKWLIDAIFNATILNIVVSKNIIVNTNGSNNQYVLDFYRDERIFESFDEFKIFVNTIIKKYSEKSKGLYVKYKNEEYLCDIEVMSVDVDRQMGPETIYEINFFDNNGEGVKVAEVSEYPAGAFSIYEINKDVEFNEDAAMRYFQEQIDTMSCGE